MLALHDMFEFLRNAKVDAIPYAFTARRVYKLEPRDQDWQDAVTGEGGTVEEWCRRHGLL